MENIRGFEHAELWFNDSLTFLVGPNNSGKTSCLRLLDWALNNLTPDKLSGDRSLSTAEQELLVPARNTRNRARRLTLLIRIDDRRRTSRFRCDSNDVAGIRIGLRPGTRDRLRANIGPPTRGETNSDADAIALWREVAANTRFQLIPARRDASSPAFNSLLSAAVRARLAERGLHRGRGGTPGEYRRINRARNGLREVAHELSMPFLEDLRKHLPPGLAAEAALSLEVEPEDVVGWMASKMALTLSTGPHDSARVAPTEVGDGLQSLLQLAVVQAETGDDQLHSIVALEEPEAFLHPSAQRSLGRALGEEVPGTRIVSTHSPIVVDEASYASVVLVRDHRFYAPSVVEARREEINTALMTAVGSEMLFARSVLLAEGPGDVEVFEQLRRRAAALEGSGALDQCLAVPVGGKQRFAPWIELIESYARGAHRPIDWFAVADGDAASEFITAARKAGVVVPLGLRRKLDELASASAEDFDTRSSLAVAANKLARSKQVPLALLPVDLEAAVLANASAETVARIANVAGVEAASRHGLMNRLGSRVEGKVTKNAEKGPWVRTHIGRSVPLAEMHPEVRQILSAWFAPVLPLRRVRALLGRLSQQQP